MNDGAAQISKNIRQELYVKYGVVNPMPEIDLVHQYKCLVMEWKMKL